MTKIYRTMQGRMVDMEKLITQHELMPAIGNIKVNARGDELGVGGKIIKKREQIVAEYYEKYPTAPKEKIEPVKTKVQDPTLTMVSTTSNSKRSK